MTTRKPTMRQTDAMRAIQVAVDVIMDLAIQMSVYPERVPYSNIHAAHRAYLDVMFESCSAQGINLFDVIRPTEPLVSKAGV